MERDNITKINIGGTSIGIMGLKPLMEEMAEEYAGRDDEEVRAVMMERLGEANYMAEGAVDEYGKAFVREFRKFLGQSFKEDASGELDIKVLGVGCAQCDGLTRMLREALSELSLPAEVDHITDLKEIAKYGVMGSPALLINGKVMAAGSVPPKQRIKKWLSQASR